MLPKIHSLDTLMQYFFSNSRSLLDSSNEVHGSSDGLEMSEKHYMRPFMLQVHISEEPVPQWKRLNQIL
jgi:hypothetical protein